MVSLELQRNRRQQASTLLKIDPSSWNAREKMTLQIRETEKGHPFSQMAFSEKADAIAWVPEDL